MNTLIRNSTDLRAEIFRLQQQKLQHELQLKQHFSSPGAIFSTVRTLFSGHSKPEEHEGKHQDWVGFLSRFILPLALNKTLFRGSGFIVKALVGLASQKASNYISGDAVTGIWDKAKGLVGGLLHKKSPSTSAPSYRKIQND